MVSTVYIAKTVYGGDGLGRLGDGRVVFVPGAFAGENVKAEIVEERRHFVRARLVEIVEPSPDRIGTEAEPAGPSVPGMTYANLSPEGELKVKESQLADFLARARIEVPGGIGRIPVAGPDGAVQSLGYRNKVVYHFARQRGRWAMGYREEPSHEIVDVTSDPLARPEINAKLGEIRANVVALLTQGPVAVRKSVEAKGNVTVRWSARTGVKWWVGDAPADVVIRESACGNVFEVPSDGFYQVNPEAGDALVRAVADAYRGGVADAPDLLDLYCGVGVFGLCCLRNCGAANPRLIGVESGRQAVEFARRNAVALKCEAKFFAEEVGRNLRRIPVSPRTTVIVDPPRGGLEPRVPEWLARSRAPRIFYVSCDPATLMRDLRPMLGAYAVESVKWVNMFPRTARFETFVALRKV